jgi:hypothetical protein
MVFRILNKMENKQTAVEWLEKQIKDHALIKPALIEGFEILLVEAKQMEKDQHCTTWYKSIANDRRELHEPSINFKQYYNETYGK